VITEAPGWLPPPANLHVSSSEVHIWRISLNLPGALLTQLHETLSADERARAARFVFAQDRDHFIAGRGALRDILGLILHQPPDRLCFSYNAYGKPALTSEPGGISFNVAHSHGLALVGVAHGHMLGVDIEYIRPDVNVEQLARQFFSPREASALLALPEGLRQKAFFSCWARKEAYIKARGEGLSIPLDQFDVSLVPGQPAALLSTPSGDVEEWHLSGLDAGPGYEAALAVRGHNLTIHRWAWSARS